MEAREELSPSPIPRSTTNSQRLAYPAARGARGKRSLGRKHSPAICSAQAQNLGPAEIKVKPTVQKEQKLFTRSAHKSAVEASDSTDSGNTELCSHLRADSAQELNTSLTYSPTMPVRYYQKNTHISCQLPKKLFKAGFDVIFTDLSLKDRNRECQKGKSFRLRKI